MNSLGNTIWIEWRKVVRSRVPWFTAAGVLIMPLASAFFMVLFKYPDFARSSGIVSAKANLMAGTADWPTYLSMLAQASAIGGILLFSFIVSWVFGREFVDGTLKDLLAVPVARSSTVLAKFIVVAIWSGALVLEIYLVALALGALVGLAEATPAAIMSGSLTVLITGVLVITTVTPIAFFASVGRGYLLPLGCAILALLPANVVATIGWGSLFPWSVPALYAGMAGANSTLNAASYWIVILTGLAGIGGTLLWWRYADQNR